MKSLISVNCEKFKEISPKELVSLIKNSKYTKGVEICINNKADDEVKYLSDLVYELKKNDLILQVHGNVELSISEQVEFIKKLEEYSDYLGYKIVITLYSVFDEDKIFSANKTIDYMYDLLGKIDNNKVVIALENLNDYETFDRLEKEKIKPIILNDESLYFTYDIGHDLVDYGNSTNIDEYLFDEIRNIHIHTFNDMGVDHMPIYKNDKHYLKISKALNFLKANNYKYNIVYEYDLLRCYGNSIKEKIIDYLNSIDLVSEIYGGE